MKNKSENRGKKRGGAGVLRIEAEVCVYDRDGELEHTEKCHSWLKQLLHILTCPFKESDIASIKDTGGLGKTVYYDSITKSGVDHSLFNTQAGANSTTYGIILGTGTTAVTYVDYVIETIIADGTGSGQLSYAAMGYTALSDITGGQQFGLTRTITNSSGASITVNEIALYVKCCQRIYGGVGEYAYMAIERTVLGTPIAIADGDAKTFEYKIKLTV